LTIGKECTVPAPTPKKGSVEAKPFTVIPNKIHYYMERQKGGVVLEDITVTGNTPDGYSVSWKIGLESKATRSCDYTLLKDGKNHYGNEYTYGSGSGPGQQSKSYYVNSPDVVIVWTLDGTEPTIGQSDEYMTGDEYPFGQVMSGGQPYHDTLQVRGTATFESSSSMMTETYRTLYNKCAWTKIYDGSTLLEEHFTYEGYFKQ
jgi:hypothetical protein